MAGIGFTPNTTLTFTATPGTFSPNTQPVDGSGFTILGVEFRWDGPSCDSQLVSVRATDTNGVSATTSFQFDGCS
jgi:hypothetical protein